MEIYNGKIISRDCYISFGGENLYDMDGFCELVGGEGFFVPAVISLHVALLCTYAF